MSKSNGGGKSQKGPRLAPTADALDTELYAFIIGLIDQNAELVAKLEQMEYQGGVTEEAIRDIQEQVQIGTSIEVNVNASDYGVIPDDGSGIKAEADKILAEAELAIQENRKKIIDKAVQEGLIIVQKAMQRAEEILAQTKEKAEAEANRIIAGARKGAEEESSRIIAVARKTAEERSQPIAKGTEQEVDNRGVGLKNEMSGESQHQASGSNKHSKVSGILYKGVIEINVLSPIALNQFLELHRHLENTPRLMILELDDSQSKGVRITLRAEAGIPLLDILSGLPDVQQVSDDTGKLGVRSSLLFMKKGQARKRITVTMKS